MSDVLKIAARNLFRYSRRTALTTLLITLGVLAVLVFIAVSDAFKSVMIGQITDAMLGHLQIHRAGYVEAVENLPLDRNMAAPTMAAVERALAGEPRVAAWSPRLKFGAMVSNYAQTTNIRLTAVDPAREVRTCPELPARIVRRRAGNGMPGPGEILLPELLAKGLKVDVGATIVLVATNADGSVNGQAFVVGGVLASVTGPGGRDGYIGLADARKLLRMEDRSYSEVAVRLGDPGDLERVQAGLKVALAGQAGPAPLEVHTWKALSPFAHVASLVDLMTFFVRVMLVAIVVISVMNVMIMAVYERMREIGTISAMGTPPGKILALFVTEGLLLGGLGALAGTGLGLAAVWGLNAAGLRFAFGLQEGLRLAPVVRAADVLAVGLVVVAMAVLASLLPAFKASRMDPLEALRHV